MLRDARIWVAGDRGLIGSAIRRRLEADGCDLIANPPRADLDLTQDQAVLDWMQTHKPDVVFLAAARVGGIGANQTYPAEFISENLRIQTNVIDSAWRCAVQKLVFLGSSCIYPKEATQPITEDALLSGPLEPSNEAYAVAKIAGITMCQAYRRQYGCHFVAVQPTNLYGPGDRFDAEDSHVIPALMLKIHQAKIIGQASVTLWGTGKPLREFLYVDDAADGIIHVAEHYDGQEPINLGSGHEISIHDLAHMVASVIGYDGDILFDTDKPDGVARKLLDSSKIGGLGWSARTPLETGLQHSYAWFLENIA